MRSGLYPYWSWSEQILMRFRWVSIFSMSAGSSMQAIALTAPVVPENSYCLIFLIFSGATPIYNPQSLLLLKKIQAHEDPYSLRYLHFYRRCFDLGVRYNSRLSHCDISSTCISEHSNAREFAPGIGYSGLGLHGSGQGGGILWCLSRLGQ